MKNECIILLGANQFQRERALVGAEKATNASIITVSASMPFHGNKYPGIVICSQETNPEQLLKDVISFLEKTKYKLIAVIPLNDFVLNAGFELAQHFDLPYNDSTVIENCRNKNKMKKILSMANIPVAKSYQFNNIETAIDLANNIGYPVVIKPLNFGGSGGVKKANNQVELITAINETKEHLALHAKHYDSDSEQMVIESYIDRAREISVEVINTPYASKVLGITEKYLCEEPYFSEIGHLVPSPLYMQKEQAKEIENIAIRACEALNIKFGMTHIEIKLSEEGLDPVVIEVGARPAGDGIMDLYEKATGINIYEYHCKAFLGKLDVEKTSTQFFRTSAIAYLHPVEGVIDNINVKTLDTKDLNNIDIITIKANVGQQVITAKNWSTRYGFIEYTFWDEMPQDFDLISNTRKIAEKVFKIRN